MHQYFNCLNKYWPDGRLRPKPVAKYRITIKQKYSFFQEEYIFNFILLIYSSDCFAEKARTAQAACSLFKLRIISLLIQSRFELLITLTEENGPICKTLDPLPGLADIINQMFIVFLGHPSTSHSAMTVFASTFCSMRR